MLSKIVIFFIVVISFLTACTAPQSLPTGPTPIPTLIPATEPSGPLTETALPSFPIQSYPARLPSAELGLPLYQTHCANCHGEDGNGVVPGARNFGDLDYMRGETPASFYNTVTEGRGEMEGFRDILTSDKIWDVIFYIWRFSTDAEKLALGQQIYDDSCQICHGLDGSGEVLGAADFSDIKHHVISTW
jgi:mono/diheme cytochrome c family protein